MELSEVDMIQGIDASRLPQLMALYEAEWWTCRRTSADVARMVQSTDLVFGFVHRPNDCLVGFARVVTDYTYLGVILDVIVAPAWRGQGLGGVILYAIVSHPELVGVQSLELVCQPDLVPFYRRWGFSEEVGESRLMRRAVAGPLLLAAADAAEERVSGQNQRSFS